MDSRETETKTFREAIRDALREEMQADEDVYLMGEDIAEYGGIFDVTDGLWEEFGDERVRRTPISEAGILGTGVGSAMTGTRPVVEIMFSDFIGVAFEQIMNQTAKLRYMHGGDLEMPLTIRTTEGAGTGSAAQHSGTIHTLFAHLPGLKVVVPGTPAAAKGLLKTSIRSNDPVLFFENKTIYAQDGEVPVDDDYTLPVGEAAVEREGDDVTVVATQRLVSESLAAADALEDEISVEVIDPRSLYPLDADTIGESLQKTGRIVVADEGPLSYGTHAEIITRLVESEFFSLDAPPERVGVPDVHIPYSTPLENEVMPDRDDVTAAIRRIS
jgi:pyruvate dehydrogenase E1 component beta subunit